MLMAEAETRARARGLPRVSLICFERNEGAQRLYVKFLRGGVDAASGNYGSGTFGDTELTYGQEATDPTLTGTNYRLLPLAGSRPRKPAWQYRVGDTLLRWQAMIVDPVDPSSRMSLVPVTQAALIIELMDPARAYWYRGFALDLGVDDVLTRVWGVGDLPVPGLFRATVVMDFDTGRRMSVETDDDVLMAVHGVGEGPEVLPV